jgi:hypothetical protein
MPQYIQSSNLTVRLLLCIYEEIEKKQTEPDIKKIKPDSGMMESEMEFEVEHREALKEDAVVMPVGGLRKRHSGRKHATLVSEMVTNLNTAQIKTNY